MSDSGLARFVCPQVVYFPEFTIRCSSFFSPSQKLIMTSDNFRVVYHIKVDGIRIMLCILEQEGLQPIKEKRKALLYQTLIPVDRNMI